MMRLTLEWTEILPDGDLPQEPNDTTSEITGVYCGTDNEWEMVHIFNTKTVEEAKEYAAKFTDEWGIGIFSVFSGNNIYFTEEDL